ncbi:6582_t:CDS:2, partial [Funneliformis geosporum]
EKINSAAKSLAEYQQMIEIVTDDLMKKEGKVRPIWILLVDSEPDENLRHMKNIIHYAHLFHALDLNYLTIRIHTQGQNAYNLVERNIASLFTKLYDKILNIQKKLCNIWKRNDIYEKPVMVKYVDQERHPFNDPKPLIL